MAARRDQEPVAQELEKYLRDVKCKDVGDPTTASTAALRDHTLRNKITVPRVL